MKRVGVTVALAFDIDVPDDVDETAIPDRIARECEIFSGTRRLNFILEPARAWNIVPNHDRAIRLDVRCSAPVP